MAANVTSSRIRAAIAAGVVNGNGLRLIESAGVVLVIVPTSKGNVIIARNGVWREGFDEGPWVEALTLLIAGVSPANTHAERARQRQYDAASVAVVEAMRGPNG